MVWQKNGKEQPRVGVRYPDEKEVNFRMMQTEATRLSKEASVSMKRFYLSLLRIKVPKKDYKWIRPEQPLGYNNKETWNSTHPIWSLFRFENGILVCHAAWENVSDEMLSCCRFSDPSNGEEKITFRGGSRASVEDFKNRRLGLKNRVLLENRLQTWSIDSVYSSVSKTLFLDLFCLWKEEKVNRISRTNRMIHWSKTIHRLLLSLPVLDQDLFCRKHVNP
jgi:hypothetical protein